MIIRVHPSINIDKYQQQLEEIGIESKPTKLHLKL